MKRLPWVVLFVACSGGSAPPAAQPQPSPDVDPPAVCEDRAWGGWNGTPACEITAARVIAGADRACAVDADCTLMTSGACDDTAVATAAASRYAGWEAPCGNPMAGDCNPVIAACVNGCCQSAQR